MIWLLTLAATIVLRSFADIFADSMAEHEKERESKHMWTDYGQSNDRQSLRKDFNPELTKSKVLHYNDKGLQ